MHHLARLDVAGHPWTIVCLPTPDFVAARRTWWSWGVLAVGLAFTALLAAHLRLSIDRRAYAERSLVERRRYARELEEKVREQTEDIRRAQEEVIYRLVAASQWRDEETGMHIRRTGLMSEVLAKAAGWSAAEADVIRQAAPMHDVGKIGIPDAVLRKPGKLTPEEFEVMKTHTLIGAEMLADSDVPMLQMAREIAPEPPRAMGRPGISARAGRAGHSRKRPDSGHRRRLRRPDARSRLPAGDARRRGPGNHARGGRHALRSALADATSSCTSGKSAASPSEHADEPLAWRKAGNSWPRSGRSRRCWSRPPSQTSSV